MMRYERRVEEIWQRQGKCKDVGYRLRMRKDILNPVFVTEPSLSRALHVIWRSCVLSYKGSGCLRHKMIETYIMIRKKTKVSGVSGDSWMHLDFKFIANFY
jgi:hypothetical protein